MLLSPATAACALVREGHIAAALKAFDAEECPSVPTLAVALECRLARGEIELALGLGERLAGPPRPVGVAAGHAGLALGRLAAATGRTEEAVGHFLRVGELLDEADDDPVDLPWRAEAALNLLRLGRSDQAQRLAREHLRLAHAQRSAYAVAGALRTVAAVCPGGSQVEQLRQARSLLGDGHARLAATIDTDLAGLLSLIGGPDGQREAVELLRSAEAYADLEDLWPLHGRVRRLLERLGEEPVTLRCEAMSRLSDIELRVARLAALGSSNRQIAELQGVTVKAVEWHLSRAYRKLGIRGRRELPFSLKLV